MQFLYNFAIVMSVSLHFVGKELALKNMSYASFFKNSVFFVPCKFGGNFSVSKFAQCK